MIGVAAVFQRVRAEVPEIDKLQVWLRVIRESELASSGISLTDKRSRRDLGILYQEIKARTNRCAAARSVGLQGVSPESVSPDISPDFGVFQ